MQKQYIKQWQKKEPLSVKLNQVSFKGAVTKHSHKVSQSNF